MAFNMNTACSAQSTDGVLVNKSITNLAVNAKVLLDDTFAAGVIDLAPYLASITNPRGCYIVAEGDGYLIDFDGLGPSVKAQKQTFMEITDNTPGPSGLLDIALTAQGAAQRIRVFAWGDPT